jgi:hypothetical protein
VCLYVPVIPARRDKRGVKLKIQQFNEESVHLLGRALRLPKIDLLAGNRGHPLTFARLGLAAQASEA